VRSRPGAARTILLFHIISARPSKQARMVGSTLGVYSFGLIFVSARTNKRHHHHPSQRQSRIPPVASPHRCPCTCTLVCPQRRCRLPPSCMSADASCPVACRYRQIVLFIGTQFSNLYTAVDTPARGRVVSIHVAETQFSVDLKAIVCHPATRLWPVHMAWDGSTQQVSPCRSNVRARSLV
jgi:hypothetical protein